MTVHAIYCGVLKELCGMSREEVYLATGDTVGTMLRVLRERMSPESKVWDSLAVAVNDEYAGLRTVLEDDDEVALLPPVSGGAL
jgi:molybdopterin converting factor small subunit